MKWWQFGNVTELAGDTPDLHGIGKTSGKKGAGKERRKELNTLTFMRTPYVTNQPQNTWDVATIPKKVNFLQHLLSLQASLRAEKQPQCIPSENIPSTPEPHRQEILFSQPGSVCGLPLPPSGLVQACSSLSRSRAGCQGTCLQLEPGSPEQEPARLLARQLSHSLRAICNTPFDVVISFHRLF